jgi:hypothetical protein
VIETIVVCLTVLAGLALIGHIVVRVADARPALERMGELERAMRVLDADMRAAMDGTTRRLDALKAPQNSKAAAAVTGGRIV